MIGSRTTFWCAHARRTPRSVVACGGERSHPQPARAGVRCNTMVAERADALVLISSVILNADHERTMQLAAKHRMPTIHEGRENVQAGGLMATDTVRHRQYRGRRAG